MGATELGFHIWLTFRVLLIALTLLYLLWGLDGLLIDLAYGFRFIHRRLFKAQAIKSLTREMLDSVSEQPIAMLIPAWDESKVIARMLLNTASSVLYKNYRLFVGTYPNDEATKTEVEKVREVFPHIEVVVLPAEGPTNQADALNWLYQGALLFEKEHGVQFAAYVLQNADDVVHPLALKYYNYLIPHVDVVQIPLLPFEREWHEFTGGCYGDEFAEAHARDTRARAVLATYIASASAGTALSRESLADLARRRRNQIFDIRARTSERMMGQLVRDLPGKKIFLLQSIGRTVQDADPAAGRAREITRHELVATREFFPATFRDAVRQKARRLAGLSRQLLPAGGSTSPGLDYGLYRDRKAVLGGLLLVLGCAVALYAALACLAGRLNPDYATPPLVSGADSFAWLLYLVAGLFGWRMLNRLCAVRSLYGGGQAWLAVPRFFWGGLIQVCATGQALFRGWRTGHPATEWGKTAHAYPTEDQLRTFRRKLGDLLLERRLITTSQLEAAMARQKSSGQKLGDILIAMGALWEEDLVHALAHQRHEHTVELDPHATPLELLKRVPCKLALQHRIYPLEMKGDTLVLATDAQQRDALRPLLQAALNGPVQLQETSSTDIDFAIARGYRRLEPGSAITPVNRLGQRLVQAGVLSKEDLRRALRQQKRSGRKLGEVLLELKLVTPDQLDGELAP